MTTWPNRGVVLIASGGNLHQLRPRTPVPECYDRQLIATPEFHYPYDNLCTLDDNTFRLAGELSDKITWDNIQPTNNIIPFALK